MAKPFDEALKRARLAEAAHLDALLQVEGGRALRLAVLRDRLAAALEDRPECLKHVELRLVSGETPRLWVDLLTSVVMEPDPRSYRLEQDGEREREVLFETLNADLLVEHVLQLEAHRAIMREKEAAAFAKAPVATPVTAPVESSAKTESPVPAAPDHAPAEVSMLRRVTDAFYSWMAGFLFGVAALLAIGMYLDLISF